jgi:CxxC motif-containing protein (DUF1111 family)
MTETTKTLTIASLVAAMAVAAVPCALADGALELQPKAGSPLRGLTAQQLARFDLGAHLYSTPIPALQGMGPIFNKTNCVSCHSTPRGGWGNAAVTHFGVVDEKGFFHLVSGESQSLLQDFAVSEGCKEHVPDEATFTATRVTNSSMAFGMVEAIPDADIAARADPEDADGDGISGRVHWVQPLEDPEGPLRAGRFGWKAQVATVLTFSADAARNEMGITNRLIPTENAPNNDAARLAGCDPVPDPEDVPDPEGLAFIDRVTDFQRYLAVPPQTPKAGMAGEAIFVSVGCARCHVPEWSTSSSAALEPALRGKVIRPYSDFLLHDMGLLGDGVTDGYAGELEMRTPTLWNLRTRDPMLHSGAASGGTFSERIRTAIALHGPYGEGAASAEAFAMLPEADKERVVAFLDSLGRLEFDATGDGHVDQLDLPSFRAAFGQPTNPNLPSAVHDIDQSGIVDAVDLAMLVEAYESPETGGADCNGNGIADVRDIATGTSADADLDGIPDDCVACRADLDRNGAVNGDDLGIMLGAWGTASAVADLDANGVVNGDDLGIMLGAWGPCP